MNPVAVSLPAYDRAPALLADAEVAFDEIRRLASLARALDPTLPAQVRFFQRAGADPSESQVTPGRVVFTSDVRPELTGGLQDTAPVDLFEALERTLPAQVVATLRQRLESATSRPSQAGIVVQAFRAAHKAGRVPLTVNDTSDPDVAITSSPALVPAALEFRDDSFLVDVGLAYLPANRARLKGEDPAFDFLSTVNAVRQALASDAGRLPQSRVREVVEQIRSLDIVPGKQSYEATSQQGWVAYSILAGGKGWTRPLLMQGGPSVDPHVAFRGVQPTVAAVAANDAQAVQALVDAGASANGLVSALPPIFGNRQAAMEELAGQFVPLAVLGAAAGATEATMQLVRAGAEKELANGSGQTALHLAAITGNEALARALHVAGANVDALDAEGRTPRSYAPAAWGAGWDQEPKPSTPGGWKR